MLKNLYSVHFEFRVADKKTEVVGYNLLIPNGNTSPPKGWQK
jgi:hypothetical protein